MMNNQNGLRAVLFDLDNTLRHSRPAPDQAFIDHAVSLGLEDDPEGRRRALRWAHYYFANSSALLADREKFGAENEEFWRSYARKYLLAFGSPPSQADSLVPEINQFMSEIYEPEDWIPQEVPATLEQLRAWGLTLGVVSNRTEPFSDYMEKTGLADHVDFHLAAGEVNSWKPEPGIFWRALELAGTQPEQTIYVGDNYYADVLGARRVGIRPVLVDPEEVFPQATCEVIRAVGDLLPLI